MFLHVERLPVPDGALVVEEMKYLIMHLLQLPTIQQPLRILIHLRCQKVLHNRCKMLNHPLREILHPLTQQ